jgi:hypothetical protein
VVQSGAAMTSRDREPSPVEPEWQVSSRKGKAAGKRDNSSPTAVAAHGAQNGVAQNGVAQNGVAQNGVDQNGAAPNGRAAPSFENLPAGELLTWLEKHAPEKYLQDRLHQLCKEVKRMQA